MPDVSTFTLTAEAYDPVTAVGRPVTVKSIRPSLDIDRVPYLSIELVLSPPDATTLAWLDPRGSKRVRWLVTREHSAGLQSLPAAGWAVCCIRSRRRRPLSGEVTVTLAGFDALLDDKRRIAEGILTTTATTLKGLVDYAVTNLTDSYPDINTAVIDNVGTAAVAIPAGDRRAWLQGETLTALFETELSAAGGRLVTTTAGNRFVIESNDRTIGAGLLLLLHTADYTGPLDGSANALILGDPVELIDRGQWADGVLVKYAYTNAAGVQVTSYRASGAGANTRGIVHNADRPAPSSNAANGMAQRMTRRGLSYTIDAAADLGVFPLMTAAIRLGNAPAVIGRVVAVEWQLPQGTMTVTVNVE